MAVLQTRFCTLLRGLHATKSPLTALGLDVRFGVCVTQVCNATHLNRPRFRHPFWHLRKERAHYPQNLTPDNKDFLREAVIDKFGPPAVIAGVPTYDSPLKNVQRIQPIPWYPGIRRTATIAKKIGISPIWRKDGTRVWSTLLQIVDNHVIRYNPPGSFLPLRRREEIIQKKNLNKYGALVVGAESTDPQNFTKEYCGLFQNTGLAPKKKLSRFLISPEAVLPVGTPLTAMHYRVGDYIDAVGTTIRRGFQGVVKRWGFRGMPATHGVTKTHRRPGNIGGGGEKGRVWPGKKMPGHMGGNQRKARSLMILRINTEYNVLWVKGQGIPGDINSYVYIHDCILRHRRVRDPKDAPPFPTYIPKNEDEELPRNFWSDDMHQFGSPSVTYEIVDTPQVRTGAKLAKVGAKTAKLKEK